MVLVQVAANVEMTVEVPPNDSVVNDPLILLGHLHGAATPLRDEPIADITQIEAAVLESDLNDLQM